MKLTILEQSLRKQSHLKQKVTLLPPLLLTLLTAHQKPLQLPQNCTKDP